MKKCIIVDIDGTLADSWEYQKKYFCSGFHDENGYMNELMKFSVNKWVEKMINIYWAEYYDIYLLSSRHESYRQQTLAWLKGTKVFSHIRKLILKSDIKQSSPEFKLEEVKKLSRFNEIDFILDDNPSVVNLLNENNFNAILVKNLY